MLRSVLGKHQRDDMLAEREKLNMDIQQVLDAQTDSWGIKTIADHWVFFQVQQCCT